MIGCENSDGTTSITTCADLGLACVGPTTVFDANGQVIGSGFTATSEIQVVPFLGATGSYSVIGYTDGSIGTGTSLGPQTGPAEAVGGAKAGVSYSLEVTYEARISPPTEPKRETPSLEDRIVQPSNPTHDTPVSLEELLGRPASPSFSENILP
jgi:hypothetical protein